MYRSDLFVTVLSSCINFISCPFEHGQLNQILLITVIWVSKLKECHGPYSSIDLAGCQSICTSTGSKPLLLNNLINSASSPAKEPPLHPEVSQELNLLLPLTVTVVLDAYA